MVSVSVKYTNNDAAERFVESCENSFDREIERVCNSILADKKSSCIVLCGPSFSGVKTIAEKISECVKRNGAYSRAWEYDEFIRRVSDGERECINVVAVSQKDALGAHEMSRKPGVKCIYVNIVSALNVCGVKFEAEEILFVRQTVGSFFLNGILCNKAEKIPDALLTYAKNSDHTINSLLPYELFVTGPFFTDITDKLKGSGVVCKEIASLRSRFSLLADSCITANMIPVNSILKEIIF